MLALSLVRRPLLTDQRILDLPAVSHMVAQASRLGRDKVVQGLYALLLDSIKVLLFLLKCSQDGILMA